MFTIALKTLENIYLRTAKGSTITPKINSTIFHRDYFVRFFAILIANQKYFQLVPTRLRSIVAIILYGYRYAVAIGRPNSTTANRSSLKTKKKIISSRCYFLFLLFTINIRFGVKI